MVVDDSQNSFNKNKMLYKQVKDYLLDKIKNGEYETGAAIHSERELCKKLDVSRQTVRKAILELVDEDYLYRVKGYGTFVKEKEIHNKNQDEFIGVVFPSIDSSRDAKILNGIQEALNRTEYRLNLVNTQQDYKIEKKEIQRLRDEGAKGLIIIPAINEEDYPSIFKLKSDKFPFLLVDRRLRECKTNCIMSDNINGSFKATEHLIKLGHKRIGFISHEYKKASSVEDRIIGYKRALNFYDLSYQKVFSYDIDSPGENNYQKQFIDKINKESLTAVITVNDNVALDFIKICKENDINIPGDYSLINFDDFNLGQHIEAPLTIIKQQFEEIGKSAVELLMEIINNDLEKYKQIYYPTKLVKRESCLEINNLKEKKV